MSHKKKSGASDTKKPEVPAWDPEPSIVAALKDKKADEHPFFLCIAGPPDSGKGALIEAFKTRGYFDLEKTVIVTNNLVRGHPVCQQLREQKYIHPEKNPTGEHPEVRETYYAALQETIRRAAEEGISIVLEEHPDDLDEMDKLLNTLAKSGRNYEKVLIGVTPSKERYFDKIASSKKRAVHPWRLGIVAAMSKNWENLHSRFDYTQLWFSRTTGRPLPLGEWDSITEGKAIYDTELYERFKDREKITCKGNDQPAAQKAWKAAGETPEFPDGRRGMECVGEIRGRPGTRDWRQLTALIPPAFDHSR